MSWGVGCRCGLDLAQLWLWCRLAAVAPTRALAWEPPYAAVKSKKKKGQVKSNEETTRQSQVKGQFTKQLAQGLQQCQLPETQRRLLQLKEAKEMPQLCDMRCWEAGGDCWKFKDDLGKLMKFEKVNYLT